MRLSLVLLVALIACTLATSCQPSVPQTPLSAPAARSGTSEAPLQTPAVSQEKAESLLRTAETLMRTSEAALQTVEAHDTASSPPPTVIPEQTPIESQPSPTVIPEQTPVGSQSLPTSAPGRSFVFTAAGDYGDSRDTTATLDLIARSGASFHLALGDLSYSSEGRESEWCAYVKSRVGETFPFQLVSGNHEDDHGGDGHIAKFAACLPDRMNSVGDYSRQYYFDYQGLARLIMISPDLTIDGEHYFYGDANSHYNWVADAIDGARAANIPWVIVGMHKTCLSIGHYGCDIKRELFDLLIEKKVDLVLHGHDHTYQRTSQLATGAGCPAVAIDSFDPDCISDGGGDNAYTKGMGPVFVVAGTAGAGQYEIDREDSEVGYFVSWMGANVEPRKGFVKVTVSDTELHAEFVGSTSTSDFSDSFTIWSPPG